MEIQYKTYTELLEAIEATWFEFKKFQEMENGDRIPIHYTKYKIKVDGTIVYSYDTWNYDSFPVPLGSTVETLKEHQLRSQIKELENKVQALEDKAALKRIDIQYRRDLLDGLEIKTGENGI